MILYSVWSRVNSTSSSRDSDDVIFCVIVMHETQQGETVQPVVPQTVCDREDLRQIEPETWIFTVCHFERTFKNVSYIDLLFF